MLNNLKIGTRLAIGFASTLILLAVIAFVSVSKLNLLEQEIDTIVNDRAQKIAWVGNVRNSINVIARAMRNTLILKDPNEIKRELDRIPEERKKIAENLEKLEKTIVSEKGKELLGQFKNARLAYIEGQNKFLELVKNGKRDDAVNYLLTDVRQLQNEYFRTINALMEQQQELMKKSGEDASATAASAEKMIWTMSIAALLLTCLFGYVITRSVTVPAKTISDAAVKMAAGDFEFTLEMRQQDEMGALADAFRAMQKNVKQRDDEMDRIRVALEAVSTSVMMADNDRNINYMNKSQIAMLSAAEADIRKDIPSFSVQGLMGRNIDGFHKNPSHQSSLLSTLTGTYRTKMSVGGRHFNLTANPIINKKGERLGTVVEWLDTTQQVKFDQELSNVVEAVSAGQFDKRMNPEGKEAGAKAICESMNRMVATTEESIDGVVTSLRAVAQGDLTKRITRDCQGEFEVIKNSVNTCVDSISRLVADASALSKAAIEGRLATRADATVHQGDFRAIVEGVNATLDAVIGPLNVAANYVDRISKGDIPAKITDNYNGDFNTIKNNLNTCIEAVNKLVTDANMLSAAAVDGRLSTRADAKVHQGDFRKIVEGVNETLDAVIGPLNVAANYVDRISKGDIPPKITDNYNGDFNTIKNNLNTCIEAVIKLVSDANMLSAAAVQGKLETRADAGNHQGDFRKIVQGVNDTLDAVVSPIQDVQRVMAAMEQGDMTQQITKSYQGDFATLKDAINNTIERLSETIAQIVTAADALNNASAQVSATAQSLSQSSSEQAASVEETTASLEEMTASVNQNTENAKVTDNMASKAASEAVEGGEAVGRTVDAMKSIADKIGIIDDIAYQTNLLALNAAIEAARAGEHGKGFAVVAAEVRKLAERSQVAAQEIGELAGSSVKMAEKAGQLLDEMVPSIRRTSDLVQEIAAASSEQSAGVGQINGAMGQLNKATQQNASASEELAATAEEMGGQAGQLQELMSFFTVDGGNSSKSSHRPSARPAAATSSRPAASSFAATEHDFERF